ncbi:MAG TPA: Fic family protein, partial [Opitutaceae bacterium]|nr:Fic family protein [Opitutaceae bacterium]
GAMPKVIKDEELAPLIAAATLLEPPFSVEQLHARVGAAVPRRTLQRRLALLVEQGRLMPEGERGGRRYRVRELERVAQAVAEDAPVDRNSISLSTAAREIRASVTRPVASRRPVGYDTSFLGRYEPNVSAYLLPAQRRRLSEIGRVGGEGQRAGTHFRKVLNRLLIDLSWNSSRLEGNTYSLLETERLLELGEGAEGKDAREARMILNHKAAIELLAEQADEIGFNRYTVCNLHALLSEDLLPDPKAGGRLRDVPVGIGGSVFLPLEMPQMIEEQFHQLLAKAHAIEDAFEQALFVMVHLPYLQPFEDVNKRVSRLAANIPLVQRNLCPLSFVDVSQDDYLNGILGVYELNRVEYLRDVFVWAYERSCTRYSALRQTLGEPDMFRVKHRASISAMVADVVRTLKTKSQAARWIAAKVDGFAPAADRPRLIETVETELIGLHEGNIARYRLRPSEYHAWRAGWR